VAFLFTDNHIVNESFVEDVNNMLNSGEITGLFPADERERVYQQIRWATLTHRHTRARMSMHACAQARIYAARAHL